MNYLLRSRLRGTLLPALALAGCLVLVSLLLATCAHASGYGELLRFPGKGTNGKGGEFTLGGKEARAFATNPETGTVYVGDEGSEELSENLHVQVYSPSGAFEADATIKHPGTIPGKGSLEGYEGFAFATKEKEKRIYALATYQRFPEAAVDPGAVAAGALYALNATPNGDKLEPAAGTGKEGLLGTTSTLGADSETQGKALLDPSGITVDPVTQEVLILGVVDDGHGKLHTAIMHVSSSGVVQYTWVDPAETTEAEEPNSPVVSPKGELFFESSDELFAMPADAHEGEPELVFEFPVPEQGAKEPPFVSRLLTFGEGEETSSGGGLALVGEGAHPETEGRIVAFAEPFGVTETGALKERRNGVLSFHYLETEEEPGKVQVTVTELGWTGGVAGEGPPEKSNPCEIGFANGTPSVAAVAGGVIDVLAPAWPEVIKFGSGGSGCLTAKAVSVGKEETIEATIDGKRISEAETSDTVTLTSRVVQGNVLSVKWNFGDGQEAQTTTPVGEQTQTAEITHKFVKGGDLPIKATIYTDNLADPELHVETTLEVLAEAEEPPVVILQPKPVTVTEGESATFESKATGEPAPSEQWEVSTNGGVNWSPISGQIHTKLTLADVTTAENGYEYRATFTNTAGKKTSDAAKLTVEPKKVHEEAPNVTTQPKSVAVVEGEAATFEATATGEPAPSEQWEVSTNDGASWTPLGGDTTSKLTFTALAAENGYEYRATFTNTAGKVSSSAAKLTVDYPATAKAPEPQSASLLEGETATFEATAAGEPAPTEQWEVSTDGGRTWSELSGQTGAKLTLVNVVASQSGNLYRVTVENAFGKATTTPAKLSVESKQAHAEKLHEEEKRREEAAQQAQKQSEEAEKQRLAQKLREEEEARAKSGVASLKEAAPRATLATTALKVSSSGALTLQVRCPTGVGVCTGTVSLRTASAVSVGHGGHKHVLTLATGSFSVHGGQAETVKLHLSAEGRSLLAHGHSLRTVASIVAHNGAGETQSVLTPVTLRLAKAH